MSGGVSIDTVADGHGWRRVKCDAGTIEVRFDDNSRIIGLRMTHPTTERLQKVSLYKIELAWRARLTGSSSNWLFRRPPGRRLPDDFYGRVAAAYRSAVAAGLSPGKTLATDMRTPQSTVNRWIAEARRRGYLAPGTQGRVSV